MRWSERRITQLPLDQLWSSDGPTPHTREERLERQRIRDLLRGGCALVILAVGRQPEWLRDQTAIRRWKDEISPRLAEGAQITLDEFPGGYAFTAEAWLSPDGDRVIAVTMHH
jgi:hypothetical protein